MGVLLAQDGGALLAQAGGALLAQDGGTPGGAPGGLPVISVTATSGGNVTPGILLRVLVLNHALFPSSPNWGGQQGIGVHEQTLTPVSTGSWGLAAVVEFPATAVTPTAAAGNTAFDAVSDSVSSNIQDYAFGTYKSTAPLVAGTPWTGGASDINPGCAVVLEIQPSGGTIALDPSSPPAVSSASLGVPASSVTTAPFLPPAGALIIALVSGAGSPYGTASPAVSDSYGLAWTLVAPSAGIGNGYAEVWAAVVPAALAISTTSLPGATVNVGYASPLAASGGFSGYLWTLASGSLPAGLQLGPDGTISGTPTSTSTATFAVTVTDSSGGWATSPPLVITPASALASGVQAGGSWIGRGPAYGYGTLSIPVNNTEHDWLFVAASWQDGEDQAMAFIADDAHNDYRAVWYTTSGSTHTQGWVVNNAAAANTVYVSTSAFVRFPTVYILAAANIGAGYVLDGITDTVTTGPGTSFTLSESTTVPDFVFTAGCFGGTPEGVTLTGAGVTWNLVPGWGNGTTGSGISMAAAWSATVSGAAPQMQYTSPVSRPYSGGMVAVKLGIPAPLNSNRAWPVISVQAAFGYQVGNPTNLPTWTDITSRFLTFKGKRGRDFELDELEAADLTVELDNGDGFLTPFNQASPYGVTLVTPLRVYADWQGRRRVVGSGIITGIPQTFDFQRGIVEVALSDDYSKLPQILLPSCMIAELMYDQPLHLWPLNDASNALIASNWSGRSSKFLVPVKGKYGGGVSGNTPSTGFGNSLNGNWTAGLDGTTDSVWGNFSSLITATNHVTGTALVDGSDESLPWTGTGATYEFWAGLAGASGTLGTFGATLMALGDDKGVNGGGNYLTVSMLSAPAGTSEPMFLVFAGGISWSSAHAIPIPITSSQDNPWLTLMHHYAISVSTSGKVSVYFDGALLASFQTAAPAGQPTRLSFGGDPKQSPVFLGTLSPYEWASVTPAGFFTGYMANAAVYDRVIDPERILSHFQSGSTGFVGETSGSRIQRFLQYARWAGPQAIEAGFSRQQMLDYLGAGYGSSGLSGAIGQYTTGGGGFTDNGAQADIAIQDVAAGELGFLYVGSDGTLAFRQRETRYNQPVKASMGDEDYALNAYTASSWAAAGGTNCTLTASSAWSYSGGKSLLMTMAATGSAAFPTGIRNPMTPGQFAGGSAWVMSPAGCSASLNIDYYDGSGTHISGVTSGTVACPVQTPVFLQLAPAAAPAGTVTAVIRPVIAASSLTGSTLHADRLRMSPGGFQVSYGDDLQITTDVQYLFNDVVVTRNVDQATIRAVDKVSRDDYFPRVFTRTLYTDTADTNSVVDVANWLVGDYSQPRQRISRITVNPADNPDLWPFVLSVDIGDLVAFQRNPVGAAGIAGVHMVLSIEFEFSPDVAEFTYVLAPVSTGSILTLDDPVYGLIGTTNELAW